MQAANHISCGNKCIITSEIAVTITLLNKSTHYNGIHFTVSTCDYVVTGWMNASSEQSINNLTLLHNKFYNRLRIKVNLMT